MGTDRRAEASSVGVGCETHGLLDAQAAWGKELHGFAGWYRLIGIFERPVSPPPSYHHYC
jgi:hypothetical protein